jgi:hypothetical protein
MVSRPQPFLVGMVALAGCLQEGPPPTGAQLFHSQDLEAPFFIKIGDQNYVRFRERVSSATTTKGAVYNLWLSSLDGSVQRKFIENWSTRWSETADADGHYFMANERTIPSGGGGATVGTWIRLGPTYEEELRLEDISTISQFSAPLSWIYEDPDPRRSCPGFPDRHGDCPQALFQRPPAPGQSYPTLYLWDGRYEMPIGADAGGFQKQVTADGSIYCILGDKRTFSRLSRPSNKLDSLRDNVSSFWLSGDGRYVALSVTDDGKSKTVIRNLKTGVELVPMRPNPSGWNGFSGSTFEYNQNATSTAQAELHRLDLNTGEDTFVVLPKPLVNQSAVLERSKDSDEVLRIDSLGHGVFTGRNDLVARRVIPGPLLAPSFTKDGKYLIHILRATSTLYDVDPQGALMFQDADLVTPDQMVSPAGLILSVRNGAPYFFTGGDKILAFWAHLGRASSDLYFADYDGISLPTNLRLIAQSIMSVSVSEHNLFGIVNVSQQDGVGDLVYRDIDTGKDIRYAQAVSDAAQLGGTTLSNSWAAYIVRGRADSDRSGLWITTLAPAVPTDAGTD